MSASTAAPALAALAVLALMLPVLLNQAPGSIDQGSTDATELPPLAEGPSPGDAAGDPGDEQVVALVADAQAAWNAGDALRAVELIETAAALDLEHPALTAAVSRMHTDAARRVDRASAAAKARRVAPAPIAAGVRRRARADALQREGNRIAALRELVETADALERARPARDLDPSR